MGRRWVMLGWVAVVATSGALLLGAATARPALDGPGFVVGFSEDLPRAIGPDAVTPARDLGAKAFRFTLQWAPGRTRVADSDIANFEDAVRDTAGMGVVLAVYSYGPTRSMRRRPQAARDEYCAYVRDALTRLPSIRDVVIWNEPNKSQFWSPQSAEAPVAYEALLARCYDVLHSAFAEVNVIGFALSSTGNDDSGSHSPGAFIRAVGDAYRASGRTRPLFDTVGHHVYGFTASERPWRRHIGSKVLSQGDWNKLMYNLWLAFGGTAQPIPGAGGVGIWYMEGGSQTAIDTEKQAAYSGTENVAVVPDFLGGEPDAPPPPETSAAPDQYTQVRDTIRLAACQPYVHAYFNFLLFDEPRLGGWQSGAFWADRTPKDSLPGFRQAIAEANSGTVDCSALKGGRPSADFTPPSTPAELEAVAQQGPLRVELSWTGPGFFVGFSDDMPRAIGAEAVTPARGLGAEAFRFTLQWASGQTRVADSDIADFEDAVRDTGDMKVVLSVYSYGPNAQDAPKTEAARDQYCAYVRDALNRLPSIRDVVIWNEPNKIQFWSPQTGSPAAYEALLARCYDMLHAAFPGVNVIGFALSSTGNDDSLSHSPGAFIRAVGEAYRASGRTRPLFDTVGHHVYGFTAAERPWRRHIGSKVLSQGDWNKLMYNLWLAFDGTAQAIPGVGRCGHLVHGGRLADGDRHREESGVLGHGERCRGPRLRGRRARRACTGGDERRPRPVHAGARHHPSGRLSAVRPRVLQLPALRRAAAQRLAVGRLLGRPDTQGLPARLPPGDRGGARGDGGLRRAQGRATER